MPPTYYRLPREIRDQIFDIVWRTSPVVHVKCAVGIVRIIPRGHSAAAMTNWPPVGISPPILGLPLWPLTSKGFWIEGLEALCHCSTELYLHDDIDKPFSVPESSSELWYHLAPQLNIFVPLKTFTLPWELTHRCISFPHIEYLDNLAVFRRTKVQTKCLAITLQESFILSLGSPMWSGITMPQSICLSDLDMITMRMRQLQVFEIVFREALEVELCDDLEFVAARKAFLDSLHAEVQKLEASLAQDMTLETKKVNLRARQDPSHVKLTHTDWHFIFRRKQ